MRVPSLVGSTSLGDDLEDVASELGNDVMVWRRDGKHSNVDLFHRDWAGKDEPLLPASLEVRDATFTDGWRVVGWRVDLDAEGGKDLRKSAGDHIRHVRVSRGYPDRNRWWPIRSEARLPPDGYWEDMSWHRQALVSDIRAVWEAFIDEMQSAFDAWSLTRS